MEIHLLAMHADIGDCPTRRDQFLAEFECAEIPTASIAASTPLPSVIAFTRATASVVALFDGFGGTELLGHCQAIVVSIDDDELAWREELRR